MHQRNDTRSLTVFSMSMILVIHFWTLCALPVTWTVRSVDLGQHSGKTLMSMSWSWRNSLSLDPAFPITQPAWLWWISIFSSASSSSRRDLNFCERKLSTFQHFRNFRLEILPTEKAANKLSLQRLVSKRERKCKGKKGEGIELIWITHWKFIIGLARKRRGQTRGRPRMLLLDWMMKEGYRKLKEEGAGQHDNWWWHWTNGRMKLPRKAEN